MSNEQGARASAVAASDPRTETEPETAPGPDRARVWQLLGPPTDQQGSVNDPRSEREQGCEWNEKWIYRTPGGSEIERIVLFNRYDLQGIFRLRKDGSAVAESLDEEGGVLRELPPPVGT